MAPDEDLTEPSYASSGVPSPWPMSDKGVKQFFEEFEAFIAENQKLLDRSQELMRKIDQLENENKQLRAEFQASEAKLHAVETMVANNIRETGDSLRKARNMTSLMIEETGKRISK
jgi:septal ring factor EnvC (AmiA/AmiB activator)